MPSLLSLQGELEEEKGGSFSSLQRRWKLETWRACRGREREGEGGERWWRKGLMRRNLRRLKGWGWHLSLPTTRGGRQAAALILLRFSFFRNQVLPSDQRRPLQIQILW
ncbi:unnamed protein product [Musa acuminata subsp. malaccensis]|uniref:(wild Malaysian banana) hypothetical protein n=1 Tax=Musa acuminata subsp. malaccensis TaxID=214687 RepID=A0A804LA28_MUSAM|nr:unnamed protein product [Musa acuminata subsp. malaccensis]